MLIKFLAFTRWQHVDLIIELIDSFLRARYNTRHVSSGLYYLSPSFSSNTICQTLRPSLCIMEGKQAWLVRKFVYSFFTYLKHTSSFSKHISKLLHNQETLLKNTLKNQYIYIYMAYIPLVNYEGNILQILSIGFSPVQIVLL